MRFLSKRRDGYVYESRPDSEICPVVQMEEDFNQIDNLLDRLSDIRGTFNSLILKSRENPVFITTRTATPSLESSMTASEERL